MTDRIVVDDHAPPSPPMRVLLVNAFYHPNLVGGAEHSVRILAESLRRLGCQVAVFTYDGGSSGIEHERVGGVPIYRASARWFGPDIFGEAGKARKAWAIIRSQHTVSYTHLDVYKRQDHGSVNLLIAGVLQCAKQDLNPCD